MDVKFFCGLYIQVFASLEWSLIYIVRVTFTLCPSIGHRDITTLSGLMLTSDTREWGSLLLKSNRYINIIPAVA